MSRDAIDRAVLVLSSGGVVAAPTDTLVGLLGLATSADVTDRVLAIKGTGRRAPLPVLVASIDAVLEVALELPPRAGELASRHWPGPLTIVLRARPELPFAVTAGTGTVGVRVPGPSLALDIVTALGRPLTGTSANLSGQPAPASTDDLDAQVRAAVDLVVSGRCPTGAASTVVDLSTGVERLVREGVIPL